ncbi:ATP dependent RNA helicase, variant [Zopfia rhizophila CBS 207.26]|uniref:RNA helicase n=1 Tax=Zopfia rhizophila CBS 207.26 TaxID=1314779 RepID=A0A6A6EB29_9PEZI|nr:ATP dependent RNA helicase, variant [Zopfia rhizophila CBS 207.26]
MRCQLGQEVGYSIRFEDVTSSKTRIKFLTDGLLLREALVDPLLSRYSVVMVDEAHERSLSSDILLGLLKKVRKRRSELRIIISSATLDAENFLQFFSDDPGETSNGEEKRETGRIVSLEGRMHPVDIHYLIEPTSDYVERAVQTIFDIHTKEPAGDILLFLTGREEIETAIDLIESQLPDLPPKSQTLQPLPLYAGLPTEKQVYVFEPAAENTRKVVISTNIAEASITMDGIVYVIDSGYVKLRAYNPTTGIETLTAVPVSKASATQRAGRAGRTKPGKCYRLYTESAHESLDEATVPEIQRSNLAPVILQLKDLGIDNIARFPYITSPPSQLVVRALELLYSLSALDDYARLTKPLGTRMAELPLTPELGKALLQASLFDCLSEMLSIAAMLTLQGNVWITHDGSKKLQEGARRKFAAEEGDHITLLNVYQAFVTKGKKEAKWCRDNYLNFKELSRAVSTRNQLRKHLERFGIDVSESLSGSDVRRAGGADKAEKIQRCLTTGFFAHAARMMADGSFKTVDGGTTLWAHPSSLLFNRKADWVIFNEVIETGNKAFIRDITKIEKDWLTEYAPEYYNVKK